MNKRLLNSDEEYFNYCIENSIGNISRTYGSQYCNVGEDEESEPCYFHYTYKSHSGYLNEVLEVKRKPTHYPCVICWHCEEGDHDYYHGNFVYMEDFKK